MSARFLQIHTLTNYAASLLNRDDAGFAKRMPFGGGVRTRISSQCLKRHWRVYDGENSLGSIDAPESVRSRIAFERYVVEPLVAEGIGENLARTAAQKVVGMVFGSEAKQEKAEKKGGKKKDSQEPASTEKAVATAQVTVLGRPELDYLCQLAREAIEAAHGVPEKVVRSIDERMSGKDLKDNLRALRPGSLEAGLGAALFGRMVTGDILSRTDAAIHVAHAMTVHAQMTESDYFTAVDDLISEDGEQGSGHINASELTSGLFYGYVVVDVNGLVKNLGDDRALAGDVVDRLIHIVSTVSPGAKKGSTAPYAYSHLVMVESGRTQPRTLQNAFIDPVSTRGSLIENTYMAMQRHLADLDGMYGKSEQRAHAGLATDGRFEEKKTLDDLAAWSRAQVLE
ncbi:MAG: type I-E CRISPR-associated protein Cas7/Cse4/CasC [Acidobacteriota bacterium]